MGQKEDWKTTKGHLKVFEVYVKKWQKVFGLFDWDIDVSRMDLGDDTGTAAAAFADINSRMAEIILNKTWNLKPTKELLNQAAFHEICELLIEPLRAMVNTRKKYNEEDIANVSHTLIRRLEHVILKTN